MNGGRPETDGVPRTLVPRGQHGARPVVLHVGCGSQSSDLLEREFPKPEWVEVRLDIDPKVMPDIVASITDMHMIETGAVDTVFSPHNVEHLFTHEVAAAFSEFARVLPPNGRAVVGVPDLQQVAKLIAEDKLLDTAYESAAGPIAPIDMVYGHRGYVARGHVFMAHRTGFTARSLGEALVQNGFAGADVVRTGFDLWAVAHKSALAPDRACEDPSSSA
ncbi:MAG TPA: methyltransferase domain-containing protein [Polyangiaceae bacterium]